MLVQQLPALLFIIARIMCPVKVGGEAEVAQFYVPLRVEQKIVRFYIAMNESMLMALFNSEYHLCHIETRKILLEDVFLYQNVQESTPGNRF